MKFVGIISRVILAVICFTAVPVCAQQENVSLEGIEIFFAYGKAPLINKEDYRLVSLVADFDFDMRPWTKKFGFNPSSLVQAQIEPFISGVFDPDANFEIGNSFFIKFGLLPQSFAVQPYIKTGVGMVYMSQHTMEQGSQFNFLCQLAGGVHCYLSEDTAFTVEYRYRHLSNSSIKDPNRGIDSLLTLFGMSYTF